MTICIAAVCKKDEDDVFVLSTDHMIDVGIGQFEHDFKKYKKIKCKENTFIAMISGSALIYNELLEKIEQENSFDKIRDKIIENFTKLKNGYIQKQLLNKFGLNDNDIKEMIKQEIPNKYIDNLFDNIAEFSLETYILLVGFEKNKAKIAEITEYGYADFSDIHFHSIGSGRVQSNNTLLFQKQEYKSDLSETIYNVYKAKRNSEVVTGVGIETDMLILTKDRCIELDPSDLDILSEIYEKELKFGKNAKELNRMKIIDNI